MFFFLVFEIRFLVLFWDLWLCWDKEKYIYLFVEFLLEKCVMVGGELFFIILFIVVLFYLENLEDYVKK